MSVNFTFVLYNVCLGEERSGREMAMSITRRCTTPEETVLFLPWVY